MREELLEAELAEMLTRDPDLTSDQHTAPAPAEELARASVGGAPGATTGTDDPPSALEELLADHLEELLAGGDW